MSIKLLSDNPFELFQLADRGLSWYSKIFQTLLERKEINQSPDAILRLQDLTYSKLILAVISI